MTPTRASRPARQRSAGSGERLFDDELEAVLRLVSEMPGAGVMWPTARNPRLRRVRMIETHHHVYFYVTEAKKTLVIVAVWGAPRGSGPKL